MLEFVDSELYFVQDKNNFIKKKVEKSTGSGSGGPKIAGSDRIRILIPDIYIGNYKSKKLIELLIKIRLDLDWNTIKNDLNIKADIVRKNCNHFHKNFKENPSKYSCTYNRTI